ncbi:MAG: hypothetical protein HY925_00725 [Elusimicrobia bacterium]|nr:hypothetical protein [Elusimicrobiota bacterium]
MVCPKCNAKAAYEAQEKCDACGSVFEIAQTPQAAPVPLGSPDAPRSPIWTRLAIALAVLLPLGYLGSLLLQSKPELTMWLSPFAPGGSVKNPCFLAGEVVDIYRLTPIEGARIAFDPKFASVTDKEGKFTVRVKADRAYAPHFLHNDYLPLHIDGFSRDWREATLEQRQAAVRMTEEHARELNPQVLRTGEYRCKRGETRTFNYALIPNNVTDEERIRYTAKP